MIKNNTSKKYDKETTNDTAGMELPPVKWYKRSFVKKLAYILVATLIAMTLWGYVLMSENPAREKILEGVQLSLESGSEADLAAKHLIVCGNINEILPDVTVTVETTLNDLPKFNRERSSEIIHATVSLRDVQSAGVFTLDITATSTIGSVVSITPSTVTITVDDLVTRNIPISYEFDGELPEGYWHGDPQLLSSVNTISGAKGEISNIVKAGCIINLDGRTESINDSFELIMYDRNENIVDPSSVVGTLPSVTVRMDILPHKDIEILPEIYGEEQMNDIYEVTSYNIVPNFLSVAADAETLLEIENIIVTTPPIDVSAIDSAGVYTFEITVENLPDNVNLLSDNHFVVTVEIQEKIETFTLENVQIEIINRDFSKFSYNFDTTTCTVSIKGRASIIRRLRSWSVSLTVNMSGYGDGVHTIIPELELSNEAWLDGIEYSVTPVTCTVLLLN